jgi:hypothetical protein
MAFTLDAPKHLPMMPTLTPAFVRLPRNPRSGSGCTNLIGEAAYLEWLGCAGWWPSCIVATTRRSEKRVQDRAARHLSPASTGRSRICSSGIRPGCRSSIGRKPPRGWRGPICVVGNLVLHQVAQSARTPPPRQGASRRVARSTKRTPRRSSRKSSDRGWRVAYGLPCIYIAR